MCLSSYWQWKEANKRARISAFIRSWFCTSVILTNSCVKICRSLQGFKCENKLGDWIIKQLLNFLTNHDILLNLYQQLLNICLCFRISTLKLESEIYPILWHRFCSRKQSKRLYGAQFCLPKQYTRVITLPAEELVQCLWYWGQSLFGGWICLPFILSPDCRSN